MKLERNNFDFAERNEIKFSIEIRLGILRREKMQ